MTTRYNIATAAIVSLMAVVSCSSIEIVKRYSTESCSIDKLNAFTVMYCSERVQNNVLHLGYCLVGPQNMSGAHLSKDGMLSHYIEVSTSWKIECRYGQWSETDTSLGHIGHTGHRQKRFLFLIPFIVCYYLCNKGGTQVVIKHPPKFSKPCTPTDVKNEYFAESGRSNAIVQWTPPTATDQDGDQPNVGQVSGGKSGSTFEGTAFGREHYIVYEATDGDGLKDSCYFSFTVTVKTCTPPAWPKNGALVCQQNYILGSTCSYTCDDGFELNGIPTITCQNPESPTWSAIPTCTKKHCSPPKGIANGNLECDDDTYEYQTVCAIRCSKGLALEGPLFERCKADVTWFPTGTSVCVDNTPPTVYCISPQTFYADRSVNTTSVKWQPAIAVDTTDPNPQIVQTLGPKQEAVFEVGTYVAKYKAIDRDENESPECSVELRVQEITCGHPVDVMNDSYMQFNCTKSTYTYGVECKLWCTANLPLNGTNTITCEKTGSNVQPVGTWSWGNVAKPFCKKIDCPKLNAPINGALIHDSVNLRPLYTMQCNIKFDIPGGISNFIGIFMCTDSGTWNPNYTVPDCIEPRNVRLLRLPSEIFYFDGNCGDNATMEQIKNNFQKIIDTDVGGIFSVICPSGQICRAERAEIECGAITGRRRRSLDWQSQPGLYRRNVTAADNAAPVHSIVKREVLPALIGKFDIVVEIEMGNKTLSEALQYYDDLQLNILKPAVQRLVTNGTFNLTGFELRNDSFATKAYGDIVCPDGYLFQSQKCKPCPLGYFLNVSTTCLQCPIGQYVDVEGSVSCKTCPVRYSTKQTGSKRYEDCIQLCSPGSYSPDGMANCSMCPVGSYQNQPGRTSCQQCPPDRTTLSNNNTDINDCQFFDVLLQNGSLSAIINSTTTAMTFMLWAKRANNGKSNITITITNKDEQIFMLYLGTTIRITGPWSTEEFVSTLSSTSWTHVALTWDTTSNILSIYNNGITVKTQNMLQQTTPLLQTGSIFITAGGETGVYITGLHLLNEILSATMIQSYATSCHMTTNDDIINMNIFHGSESAGISILAPSACDALDECNQSACGNYSTACINGQDNFKCICLSGWTGANCSIPPDYCSKNTCQNGATCVSGYTNYTCTCRAGYIGTFCEVPPVDGAWSTWSQWSECSVTCGTGSRSRKRSCGSPPPDAHGKVCVGISDQSQNCSIESCPVCQPLKRQYGTFLNCSTNQSTGLQTCQLYCADGMLVPIGVREFQEFHCGMETNYLWQTMDNVPSCVTPVAPRGYSVTTKVEYTNSIPTAAQDTFTSALENNILTTTNCTNSSNCVTSVTLDSASARRRRNAGTLLTMTNSINFTLEADLRYDLFVSNQTVSGPMQDIINAIIRLETIAQYINNNTNSVFNVVAGGVTYTVDTSSLKITASTTCDAGHAATDALCVKCPAGTYLNNGVCSFCERGTYQTITGQTSCISCPTGLSTDTIGSNDQSKCSQSLTTPSPNSSTSFKIPDPKDGTGVSPAVSVAIALSVIAFVSVCTFIIVINIKKVIRRNTQSTPSEANFTLIKEPSTESFTGLYFMNTPIPQTAPLDYQEKVKMS